MQVLGIDVGGTGIKGALVDTETGHLVTERYRLLTPQGARPKPVAETVGKVVEHFEWHGAIGCGFPAVVKDGTVYTAANISRRWIGYNVREAFADITGCDVAVMNDADVAGLAEMRFGAGRGVDGTVLIVTLGTGIGTAMFVDGHLVPNLELGHIEIRGKDAETRATDGVRKEKGLSWEAWGSRVNEYLQTIDRLLWPDLIIVGGGASKSWDKFSPYLDVRASVVPAGMLNEAGIVGAALATLTIGSATVKSGGGRRG
ncbi:MAG: ROK family protein [Anaerolineae bacterium]|nr:ROK family protein [Anaerolineae bacterium]